MNRHLLTRRGLPVLVASLGALAVTSSAQASLVLTDATGTLRYDSRDIQAVPDAATANLVVVKRIADDANGRQRIEVRDTDPSNPPQGYTPKPLLTAVDITVGQGCVVSSDKRVATCTAQSADKKFTAIEALLNGGDDFFAAADPSLVPPATVDGGDGADTLNGTDLGDTLIGGAGSDILHGLAGDDTLDPGTGSDDPITGGAGNDTVTYAGRTDNLFLSIDTLSTNDGAAGEQDRIGTDVENIVGGDGNDVITGNGAANALTGGAGNDAVTGNGGADVIDLGAGANSAGGGAGNDTISGGDDGNVVSGGADDDTITTGAGADTINGDGGIDTVTAGGGNDSVLGGDGADVLDAGAGNDTLQGGADADTLTGGAGVDTISYAEKTEPVFAQAGSGRYGTNCEPAPNAACENDQISGAENYIGGSAGDHLVGGAEANVLTGNGGDDLLEGLAGADTLVGGDGNDELRGGSEADSLSGDDGNDKLVGGTQGDTIKGGNGSDEVSYADATDKVTVTLDDNTANDGQVNEGDNLAPDIERIEGGDFDDSLSGSDAPNTLVGGKGADVLVGKGGPDVLDGGLGTDSVSYAGAPSAVTVTADGLAANDGPAGENDNVLETVENVTGSSFNDSLTGSSANNRLNGGAGDDVLDGKLGADNLVGGGGIDTVVYSDRAAGSTVTVGLDSLNDDGAPGEGDFVENDVENLIGGAENDTFSGSPLANVLDGGAGADTLNGAQGKDVLLGGAGDDELNGDQGDDLLDGGLGADAMAGGSEVDTVDYSQRTAAVSVTLDDVADDGEATEGDNVSDNVEKAKLADGTVTLSRTGATSSTPPAGGGGGGGGGSTPVDTKTDDGKTNDAKTSDTATPANDQGQVNTASSQSGTTKSVAGAEESAVEAGVLSATKSVVSKRSVRSMLIKGKVTAPKGKSCSAGRLAIRILSGSKALGSRTVAVGKDCTFSAPISFAKSAKGTLKVEVRFLGSKASAPKVQLTKLQVKG
jgi:Ca2+-binding RTX toxin-like protein